MKIIIATMIALIISTSVMATQENYAFETDQQRVDFKRLTAGITLSYVSKPKYC